MPRLRAVMPSNLRALDQPISDELGNEFGLVLPPLPTDEPDAGRRIERMHATMSTIKRTNQALASFAGHRRDRAGARVREPGDDHALREVHLGDHLERPRPARAS